MLFGLSLYGFLRNQTYFEPICVLCFVERCMISPRWYGDRHARFRGNRKGTSSVVH